MVGSIGQAMAIYGIMKPMVVWQNTPEDIASAALVGQKPGDPKVVNHYTEDDRILMVLAYLSTIMIRFIKDYSSTVYYGILRNDFTLWKDLTLSVSL